MNTDQTVSFLHEPGTGPVVPLSIPSPPLRMEERENRQVFTAAMRDAFIFVAPNKRTGDPRHSPSIRSLLTIPIL